MSERFPCKYCRWELFCNELGPDFQNDNCLKNHSRYFEYKWYKTKTFGRILAVVVLIAWIGIAIWLSYFQQNP